METIRNNRLAIIMFTVLLTYAFIADAHDRPAPFSCKSMVAKTIEAPTADGIVYIVAANCKEQTIVERATGWITTDSSVITARHAVVPASGPDTFLRTPMGVVRASSILAHRRYDLVVIKTSKRLNIAARQIAAPQIGEHVVALGAKGKKTVAMPLTYLGKESDGKGLMIDAYAGEVIPGYSGGPIINSHNQVVSITYAKNTLEPYAYAVPIGAAHDLIAAS